MGCKLAFTRDWQWKSRWGKTQDSDGVGMESRRQFLKKSALMTTAGLGVISYGSVSSAEPLPSAAEVPDTLDMAERGERALNGVLGSVDPDIGFEPYFLTFLDVHPAYMIHWSSMVSGVLPKYLEAVPMLRLMSGSDQGRDIEKGILDSVIANVSEDGLIYDRAAPNRPWNTGVGYGVKGWNEDYANLAGNGRLLAGFLFYYQFTGDESWRKLAQRTAQRMRELAIIKGDYAYYPNVGLGNEEPSPSGQDLEWCRAFRRESLRTRITPTKAKPSYEPPNLVINWDLRAV